MTVRATSLAGSAPPEFYPFLSQAVSALRWATIAVLLVLTAVEPKVGRLGMANWVLILLFAAYNLAIELLLYRFLDLHSLSRRVVVDLPVAAAVYLLGGDPGAPLFVLLFLAVICAAVSLPVRASLIYTGVAISLTVLIEPTMPYWVASTESIRELGTARDPPCVGRSGHGHFDPQAGSGARHGPCCSRRGPTAGRARSLAR